ncbi:MAG: hypothetical protein FWC13_03185 [Oscillospiraceae bacterium]|nr:hypothetical protein [Oscillospiraceae bacterium]
MKIALGMIVPRLSSCVEIMSFIDNASRYGHELDCVIVAHSQTNDSAVVKSIREKVTLHLIDVMNPEFCFEKLTRLDSRGSFRDRLLRCPVASDRGLVPYGFNRSLVVIEAILRGIDILFFTDSDVVPSVLKKVEGGQLGNEQFVEDIDFFGVHLNHLNTRSDATTGEYSGYNILPLAQFDHMEDLLFGVQKEGMLDYWQTSSEHRGLVYQPDDIVVKPSNKVLGGNMAIHLDSFSKLPPFFSSTYVYNDELFLCRGEDTGLGIALASEFTFLGGKGKFNCTDIGIYPLHDTFKSHPVEPDLKNDINIQQRFYYALTGWVGRNPLLNFILGNDLTSIREFQRERLAVGLDSLSTYTSNPKFKSVLGNFDESWDNTDRYISEYKQTLAAWHLFMKRVVKLVDSKYDANIRHSEYINN